jgi:hypothetical protein
MHAVRIHEEAQCLKPIALLFCEEDKWTMTRVATSQDIDVIFSWGRLQNFASRFPQSEPFQRIEYLHAVAKSRVEGRPRESSLQTDVATSRNGDVQHIVLASWLAWAICATCYGLGVKNANGRFVDLFCKAALADYCRTVHCRKADKMLL